jgi:hypothetical protein
LRTRAALAAAGLVLASCTGYNQSAGEDQPAASPSARSDSLVGTPGDTVVQGVVREVGAAPAVQIVLDAAGGEVGVQGPLRDGRKSGPMAC